MLKGRVPELVKHNMKQIKGIAKQHYFEKRKELKKRVEARKKALARLWAAVTEAVQPILRFAKIHAEPFILESIPVRDKNMMCSFIEKVPFLLSELFDRCFENSPSQTKIFSFHRNAIECFNKNKHYKGLEFGRQFQLGRLEGNFIYLFRMIRFVCLTQTVLKKC